MAYEQTEAVILEQLKAGNYVVDHTFLYWLAEGKLTIPKTKGRPKISIEFPDFYWNDEEEVYRTYREGKREWKFECWLSTWWQSQRIGLYNEEVKDWLKEVAINYWMLEGEKRRKEIAKEDQSWAEKFR